MCLIVCGRCFLCFLLFPLLDGLVQSHADRIGGRRLGIERDTRHEARGRFERGKHGTDARDAREDARTGEYPARPLG